MLISETKRVDTAASCPTVSVIIPAYNVAPFIREALDSVFTQTFTDFEVIIINDESPDTMQLEEAIRPYRNSITYLKQTNQGAGAARNAGLRIARGEFVAFLDADDVWLPDFLQEQLRLTRTGDYDLAYADAMNFGESGFDGATNMAYNPSFGEVTFKKLLCGQCNIVTSTVLARREPILRIGCFDESFKNSQDFDLWLRLAKDASARMTYQKKVLVKRRIHNDSLAGDPIRSFGGELAVLSSIRQRTDLSADERAVLEDTMKKRHATVEVLEGKKHLAAGNFKKAAESFATAHQYWPTGKIRMVLLGLRIAPRTLRTVFRLRSN